MLFHQARLLQRRMDTSSFILPNMSLRCCGAIHWDPQQICWERLHTLEELRGVTPVKVISVGCGGNTASGFSGGFFSFKISNVWFAYIISWFHDSTVFSATQLSTVSVKVSASVTHALLKVLHMVCVKFSKKVLLSIGTSHHCTVTLTGRYAGTINLFVTVYAGLKFVPVVPVP